jgi:hypothetical protein
VRASARRAGAGRASGSSSGMPPLEPLADPARGSDGAVGVRGGGGAAAAAAPLSPGARGGAALGGTARPLPGASAGAGARPAPFQIASIDWYVSLVRQPVRLVRGEGRGVSD